MEINRVKDNNVSSGMASLEKCSCLLALVIAFVIFILLFDLIRAHEALPPFVYQVYEIKCFDSTSQLVWEDQGFGVHICNNEINRMFTSKAPTIQRIIYLDKTNYSIHTRLVSIDVMIEVNPISTVTLDHQLKNPICCETGLVDIYLRHINKTEFKRPILIRWIEQWRGSNGD